MHGDQVGTLNVYITDQAGAGPMVWTRDSDQGDQWLRGQIGIDLQLATYQVRSRFREDIFAVLVQYSHTIFEET